MGQGLSPRMLGTCILPRGLTAQQAGTGPATRLSPPPCLVCPVGPLEPHSAPSAHREEPVREFTGKVAPADVLDVLCRERASFERAAEPLQPQARALLALQWGLLSTPRQK